MKHIILFSVSVLFVCLSCVPSDINSELSDIETYISVRPDSALHVLDSMDRGLLTSKSLKARHALLYVMASDKNFIDVTDDSISRLAVDYYRNHGKREYYARALYYHGVAYYNRQEYDNAILEFTKAEKVARQSDSLYLGMIKTIQADTYRATYNELEQYNCLQESVRIFRGISQEHYLNVAEFQMAQLLADRFDYEQSEQILLSLLSHDSLDRVLRVNCQLSYAFVVLMRSNDNAEQAVEIYESILSEWGSALMTIQGYWAYAYALNIIGEKQRSEEVVRLLESSDTSEQRSYWQYRIAKINGDHVNALRFLEESNVADNLVITEALNQSLSIAQRDYHETQSELAEYKARNRLWGIFAIIITVVFLLSIAVYIVNYYIRMMKEEKENNLLYAEELIRQLKYTQEEDRQSLKDKYINLYRNQFETLRVLCDEYFQNQNRQEAEKKIYERVVAIIDEIRNDTCNNQCLETMLNEGFDGIMTNLREELPRLKDLDRVIFGYFAMGFDATTISHLVNKSINTIYIRKSRIKAMIEEVNPVHKIQFLERLS